MPITRLSVDGYGARRAGDFSGRAEVIVLVPETRPVGVGPGRAAKKRKYEKQHVWLVEIDDEEIQVDDLEEIQPIVKKKLAKGKTPTVKAKPLTENPREAATAYTEQDFLTQYVPMPVYERRLDFVNILPYIIAMQEMEDEEEILLMMAA